MSYHANALRNALLNFWAQVQELPKEDSKAFINECALACVRKEFRAKFLRELNSRRPITSRFFYRVVELEMTSEIEAICGFKPAAVDARVIWGSFDDPVGFHLHGPVNSIDALFVQEGDAIGHLLAGRYSNWFFLSGASGALWRLKKYHEQT